MKQRIIKIIFILFSFSYCTFPVFAIKAEKKHFLNQYKPKTLPLHFNLIEASFSKTGKRFPPPDTILSFLYSHFSILMSEQMSPRIDTHSCHVLTDENRKPLGDNNPINGTPHSEIPNDFTFKWYADCLNYFVYREHSIIESTLPYKPQVAIEVKMKDFLGKALFEFCSQENNQKKFSLSCLKKPWSEISESPLKNEMILHLIKILIGPEEIIHFLYQEDPKFLSQLKAPIENRGEPYTTVLLIKMIDFLDELMRHPEKRDLFSNIYLRSSAEPNLIEVYELLKWVLLYNHFPKF